MPKKPTNRTGSLSFSKDGKVKDETFLLSSDKEAQEFGAIEKFIKTFNSLHPQTPLTELQALPENDHDAKVIYAGSEVFIQLSELSDFSYTKKYDSSVTCSKTASFVRKGESEGEIWVVDEEKKSHSLVNVLKAKFDKHYDKNRKAQLWLVIFSTSFACMQAWQNVDGKKVLVKSSALIEAQKFLSASKASVFDQIWFSDLTTGPIKLWPDGDE